MKSIKFILLLLIVNRLNGQDKKTGFDKHFTGSVNIGAWIPTGKLKAVGAHPSYGGRIGMQLTRSTCIEFITDIRFLNSQNNYDYFYQGIKESDNYYRSMLIGLQIEQRLLFIQKNEIGILLGCGYDKLDFKDKNIGFFRRLFEPGISADSGNLNAGLIYNKEMNSEIKFGLYISYNFIDYTKHDKFDYSGNTLTAGLRIKVNGSKMK